MNETDAETENRQWKRLVQELAISLYIQNSEQINTPDHARMILARHFPKLRTESEKRVAWKK